MRLFVEQRRKQTNILVPHLPTGVAPSHEFYVMGVTFTSFCCSLPHRTAAANTAGGDAAPHPVWGVTSPAVRQYVRLLTFLCGEELARLRVWTEPLRYADASKAGHQVWQCHDLNPACGADFGTSCRFAPPPKNHHSRQPPPPPHTHTQPPWREYVTTAWQVDPALALSLLDHFPGAVEARTAAEALVVRHGADVQASGGAHKHRST